MDSTHEHAYLAAPCLAISAVLFFLGTGLAPVWILTWFAAIPVLWIAPRVSGKQAFFVAMAAYALGGLNEWSYTRSVLATWIVASILLLTACAFAGAVALFRAGILRGKYWEATVLFPATWAALEFLVAQVSVHGTFGNISYSQMNFLPILQIASVTGIWGITFSLLLFAATVAMLFQAGSVPNKLAVGAGVVVFLAAVLGFGYWRLHATPKDAPKVKVALIASSAPGNISADTPEEAQGIFQRYAEQVQALSGQGIQLFVLPEHSGPVTNASKDGVDAFFAGLAKQMNAYVAIGVDRIEPTVAWNQERLYSPEGGLIASYNKHHLLPPWENRFKPDTKRETVKTVSGTWGLAICKDMDFPKLSREYSRDGVALLVVPAWDFVDDGWLHGRMAILRGIESGFSIARSAKLGILTATDDRGRVLAERKTIGPVFAVAVGEVPVHHDATIYSRYANWFGWLCVLGCIALVVTIFRSSKIESNSH